MIIAYLFIFVNLSLQLTYSSISSLIYVYYLIYSLTNGSKIVLHCEYPASDVSHFLSLLFLLFCCWLHHKLLLGDNKDIFSL